MKNSILSVLLLLAALIAPQTGFAENVTVIVKGMVCSFCAQGLKRTFEKKPEVKSIEVNLESKEVKIHFADGKSLPDTELEQLIKDAGYDVLRIDREGANG